MTISPADLLALLKERHNVLLYGPPATGKTYLMQEVVKLFESSGVDGAASRPVIDTEEEEHPFKTAEAAGPLVRWVTFHQSYSYEDFVLGLRPDPDKSGVLPLRTVPGVLLELAAHAEAGGEALLVIDELNRGNASRIFGEFITLLEPDKRLDSDGNATDTTIHVQLPYLSRQDTINIDIESGAAELQARFALPKNIYTLATMNSVDKSVAPLDVALRRRFQLVELRSDVDDLRRASGLASLQPAPQPDSVDYHRLIAIRVLERLNAGIAFFLGGDVELGAWYLAPLRNAEATDEARDLLAELWWNALVPQLAELFHGQTDQLIDLMNLDSSTPLVVVQPSSQQRRLGGQPFLRRGATDVEATVAYLETLSGLAPTAAEDEDTAE